MSRKIKTLKISEFNELCKKHWPDIMSVEFICPKCKTIQTGKDLIEAGAGKDFDEVNKYLGFSCVGRFTETKGCDWTLGGLFSIHTLEIVSDEDPEQKRMCFDINFPVSTEAQCQQEKTQA